MDNTKLPAKYWEERNQRFAAAEARKVRLKWFLQGPVVIIVALVIVFGCNWLWTLMAVPSLP